MSFHFKRSAPAGRFVSKSSKVSAVIVDRPSVSKITTPRGETVRLVAKETYDRAIAKAGRALAESIRDK